MIVYGTRIENTIHTVFEKVQGPAEWYCDGCGKETTEEEYTLVGGAGYCKTCVPLACEELVDELIRELDKHIKE